VDSLVIEGCAVATVDGTAAGVITDGGTGTEHGSGHLILAGGRITAVGAGPAPAVPGARTVNATGCLATPGLIGTHHHLFQGLTRGLAQESSLLPWLAEHYPRWAGLDPELHGAAARAGLATLALSGCSATADHHYLFPRGSGDLLAAGVDAARQIGLRLHACRGSLDLGQSAGGLPPDDVTEDRDEILTATERAIGEFHGSGPDAMVRVAVAPVTPFAVTGQLMRESAELARRTGVRLHTHLAEGADEHDFSLDHFGCTPAEYLESLGWLGNDVWLAHGVHLDPPAILKLSRAGTGVAHCPTSNARLGVGIAPVPELLAAGVPVGLGVDGAAANDYGGLAAEMRQSLLAARARRGATALGARQVLAAATMGGARCLGRQDEIGSLEVGKQADVALWRLDDLGHGGVADPVWALVCGPPARLELLTVAGRPVVEDGQLRTADPAALGRGLRAAARTLAGRYRPGPTI
jgi:cytosine/adenosine deaminase-related metal-dependent hydrolase